MSENKVMRWFAIIIVGAIAFSFVYVGAIDSVIKLFTKNYIAKVDGESINNNQFLQMLDAKKREVKKLSPNITSEEFYLYGFTEGVLYTYIRQQVMIRDMESQGFAVSDNTLRQFIKDQKMFNIMSFAENYRLRVLEELRAHILAQQMTLNHGFSDDYIMLLHESFFAKRKFDLIKIRYSDLVVDAKPSDKDLENTEVKHANELIDEENRSFNIIEFNSENLETPSKAEVKAYIEKNKLKGKSAENEAIAKILDAKHKQNLKLVQKSFEEAEPDMAVISKQFGYKIKSFTNIYKNGTTQKGQLINIKNLNDVMSEVFATDINQTSDVDKKSFIIQIIKINPRKKLEGIELKQKLMALWTKDKQTRAGQKLLDELSVLKFPEDNKKFNDLVASKKLPVSKDLVVSYFMPEKDRPKEVSSTMSRRVLSTGIDKIAFISAPDGVLIAKITADVPIKVTKKEINFPQYQIMARESALNTFEEYTIQKHKIVINQSILKQIS